MELDGLGAIVGDDGLEDVLVRLVCDTVAEREVDIKDSILNPPLIPSHPISPPTTATPPSPTKTQPVSSHRPSPPLPPQRRPNSSPKNPTFIPSPSTPPSRPVPRFLIPNPPPQHRHIIAHAQSRPSPYPAHTLPHTPRDAAQTRAHPGSSCTVQREMPGPTRPASSHRTCGMFDLGIW